MSHHRPVPASTTRPPLVLAFFGWLAFVFAPALLLWITINHGLDHEEKRVRGELAGNMMQEYEAFRRELETPGLLERQLGVAIRTAWAGMASPGAVLSRLGDPAGRREVWQTVQANARIPLLALIWHGPDTRECWVDQRADWSRPLPRKALAKFLANANGQNRRHPCDPGVSLRSDADGQTAGDAPTARDAAAVRNLLALTLGDVTRTQVIPGHISTVVTSAFGGGRVHLLYLVFTDGADRDAPVRGGCLALVRERDLSARTLLRAVVGSSLVPGMHRTWRTVSPQAGKFWLRRHGTLPLWLDSARGQTLLGRPGPWFSHFIASHGTFRVRGGAERVALEVTVPRPLLDHPLRRHLPACHRALVSLNLLGVVLFLHLGLYGFGTASRLGPKILLGAAIAACFPILLLAAGVSIYQQVQASRLQRTVTSRLHLGQQMIDRLIRQHVVDMGQQLLGIGDRLALAPMARDAFENRVKQELDGLPVQDIFGRGDDGRAIHLTVGPEVAAPEPKSLLTALQDVARMYAGGVRAVQGTEQRPSDPSLLGIRVDPVSVGDFLARPGLIMPYQVFRRNQYLAALPVRGPPGSDGRRPTAVLLLRFTEDRLLDHFIGRHRQFLAAMIDRLDDWTLNFAILSTDRSEQSGAPAVLLEPEAGSCRPFEHLFRSLPALGETVTVPDDDADHRRIVSLTRLPRVPAIVLAWADAPVGQSVSGAWGGLIAYVVLLLGVVIGLLNRSFHQPIIRLAQVATAVADGHYPREIGVEGRDEIGQLGATFAELVQVLRHRDELAHFVSDEVLAAVRGESEHGLAPGGELAEVSILFAGLHGFKTWVDSAPPEVAVQVLDTLLAAGATILSRHGGSLDKIVEDTLMGVFRHTAGTDDHAVRAVRAALALHQQLPGLLEPIVGAGGPSRPEIGVASGSVLSGRIGSRHGTLDFSVIGNAVNLASRFKGQAKKGEVTRVMIAPATLRLLRGQARVRFVERVVIKGRTRSFPLYELLEMRDTDPPTASH